MYMDKQKVQWTALSHAVALDTPWFQIHKDHMRTPTGTETDYYIHAGHDSVICLCVTDDNKVLIEQQYRPPVSKVSTDYPAGHMEEDDASTEAAIRRELKEEVGFEASSMQKIATLDKDPGFSKTRLHVFLARGHVEHPTQPDVTEQITARFVTSDEILELIDSGTMSCTFCVSTTLLAFRQLGWLVAPQRLL